MAIWQSWQAEWLAQRGHLFPWVPVCLGAGIGAYFTLRSEPSELHYAYALAGAASLILLGRLVNDALSPLLWGGALIALGFCLAGWRAHQMDLPVLGWRYYGPVEGRIVGIDRSSSDALRLTLDKVQLDRVSPGRTPDRVRVSLHGQQGFLVPEPGQYVMMTAHLSPPGGPVEPGGFDFQRHAWFLKLGAVGYTRTPVLVRAPPDGSQKVFAARMVVSAKVQKALPGEPGAFATAIMTGDRSAMGQETLRALRVTNLAHLLAISGLHMGLLAGFVFATLRYLFAAIPAIGLRLPAKKLAALCALPVAAGYLALSGGNVATERAFIMVAVALTAVLLDRRAFSLRAVAFAAVIVLTLRPEALLGPGFQMSFAATTALVAVYNWIRDHQIPLGPRWTRPITAVLISSTVAGLATAPIAAAHFNQFAHYGLIANLLSVPLMGVLVMPAAVVAAFLMPLGLEWIALWVMGKGVAWILGVAKWVSELDGARGTVISPGGEVLPLIALGALMLVLWQGRVRFAGVIPVALAFGLWTQTERPDILISDTGALVGVMTPEGRALNRPKGGGFIAQNWLENDGDPAEQDKAAERWAMLSPASLPLATVRGKKAAAAPLDCDKVRWIVMNADPPEGVPEGLGCAVLHPASLRQTGAMAIYKTEAGYKEITARQVTGTRLWNAN
ncbi:ComEC/Rec2 family competence protein [Roseovarius sp. 2305UL8-3]|uniref:ComEC/Rec2 family competence protein n=1 Tax=Roseovarius conchicola TaxID=3121636 RepID=UPI003528D6DC